MGLLNHVRMPTAQTLPVFELECTLGGRVRLLWQVERQLRRHCDQARGQTSQLGQHRSAASGAVELLPRVLTQHQHVPTIQGHLVDVRGAVPRHCSVLCSGCGHKLPHRCDVTPVCCFSECRYRVIAHALFEMCSAIFSVVPGSGMALWQWQVRTRRLSQTAAMPRTWSCFLLTFKRMVSPFPSLGVRLAVGLTSVFRSPPCVGVSFVQGRSECRRFGVKYQVHIKCSKQGFACPPLS